MKKKIQEIREENQEKASKKTEKIEVALIGGSGFYQPDFLKDSKKIVVSNEYGEVELYTGKIDETRLCFLPRHKINHSLPPGKINFRANLLALKKLGVKRIFATSAVGSLNTVMAPGEIVFFDDFIDFTHNRPATFYDKEGEVYHVDVTEPYCLELRTLLIEAASELRLKFHPAATYVCTEGPRFETPAEIKAFQKLGADVVGMTGLPEVVLARELEICYAGVGLVTNLAAGISQTRLTAEEVVEVVSRLSFSLKDLIRKVLPLLPSKRSCPCATALQKAKM